MRWDHDRLTAVLRLAALGHRGKGRQVAIGVVEGCSWREKIAQNHFGVRVRDLTEENGGMSLELLECDLVVGPVEGKP